MPGLSPQGEACGADSVSFAPVPVPLVPVADQPGVDDVEGAIPLLPACEPGGVRLDMRSYTHLR